MRENPKARRGTDNKFKDLKTGFPGQVACAPMQSMQTRASNLLLWCVVAVTLAVYLVMVLWSLPKIAAWAGGLAPFDMRPLGYAPGEARAFLAALPEEGRAFYREVQHRLDLAFPGLMATSLLLAFRRLAPGVSGLALGILALVGAGFDYAENAAVSGLLSGVPTDAELITASRLTLAKSAATTLALSALVVLLVRAGLQRWRG
jgi:uncharacterized membrane protein (UPF0136 family)